MKKVKCSVCNYRNKPRPEYVIKCTGLFGTTTRYDAMDCEECGCQIILKLREEKAEALENENSQ